MTSRGSPAAHVRIVLVDRAADQRAERAADQGPGHAVAAAVDDVADQGAAGAADDEADRAVAPLAIIAAVGAAIDLVLRAQPPFLVAPALAIIAGGVVIGRIGVGARR